MVLCNAQYGLMRAAVLKRVRPLGLYLDSDNVLLAELSLYGTFWEIPERLFFRRMHSAASSSMRGAERQRFYDPTTKRRGPVPPWRTFWEPGRAGEPAPGPAAAPGRGEAWGAGRALRGCAARPHPGVVPPRGFGPGVLGAGGARRLGLPGVGTARGYPGGRGRNRLYERLQRRALRRFDAVVAVSRP